MILVNEYARQLVYVKLWSLDSFKICDTCLSLPIFAGKYVTEEMCSFLQYVLWWHNFSITDWLPLI